MKQDAENHDAPGQGAARHVNADGKSVKQTNPAQETAIRHGSGPCAVIAGPGSGKTFVLVKRIQYLTDARKVLPSSILVLTFSRAAAAELRSRHMAAGGAAEVVFGTFHAVFFRILQESSHEKLRMVESGVKRSYLGHLCGERPSFLPEKTTPDELQHLISRFKNGLPCPQPWLPGLVRVYNAYLQNRGCLDFDDMILRCRDLFRDRPDVLALWRKRFRWILVDEFQDVSRTQYELLRLLAAPGNNLFAVGDDDQSIYGFRGADPGTLQQFLRDYDLPITKTITKKTGQRFPELVGKAASPTSFPGITLSESLCPEQYGKAASPTGSSGTFPPDSLNSEQNGKVVFLTTNYRCSRAVLRAGSRLILENKNRIGKTFLAGSPEKGAFFLRPFTDPEAEYALIATELKSMDPQALSKTAVIFRTHSGAMAFLSVLEKNGIPFRAEGTKTRLKQKPSDRSRILEDLCAYYRCALWMEDFETEIHSDTGCLPSEAGIHSTNSNPIFKTGNGSGSEPRYSEEYNDDVKRARYRNGSGSETLYSEGSISRGTRKKAMASFRRGLLRIMNRPERYLSGFFIPQEALTKQELLRRAGFEREAAAELFDDLELLSSLSSAYSFRYLLDSVGYRAFAQEVYQDAAGILTELSTEAKNSKNTSDWLSRLETLSAKEERNSFRTQRDTKKASGTQPVGMNPSCVNILTMHACKGLEFDRVYIPDLNEGNIPSRKAWAEKEIEEERRLLYVAMTRAKLTLTITYLEGTPDRPAAPSRFLRPFLRS